MEKILHKYSRYVAKQSDTLYRIMNILYSDYDFNNFIFYIGKKTHRSFVTAPT